LIFAPIRLLALADIAAFAASALALAAASMRSSAIRKLRLTAPSIWAAHAAAKLWRAASPSSRKRCAMARRADCQPCAWFHHAVCGPRARNLADIRGLV